MQDHDKDWDEYQDHVIEPEACETLTQMLRMAFCAGRVAGFASLGEKAKREGWALAWRRLTVDALRKSEAQADVVLSELQAYEATEARRN